MQKYMTRNQARVQINQHSKREPQPKLLPLYYSPLVILLVLAGVTLGFIAGFTSPSLRAEAPRPAESGAVSQPHLPREATAALTSTMLMSTATPACIAAPIDPEEIVAGR